MDTTQVVQIGREMLLTALVLSLPTIAASLIVGLCISILQTITSVQEQTLSFAPRIIAVGAVLIVSLPWTIRVVSSFTLRMLEMVAGATA
ncbi:MAG: flagellar biosynthetic protein FliQ [Planctomycetaceae bacterium]